MRKDIKEKILKEKKDSLKYVQYIRNNKNMDKNQFSEIFVEYLYNKLFILKSEVNTNNIYEICKYSVDKISKLPKNIRDSSEYASKCGGATTAINKKALLLIAIRREFEIDFDGMVAANIETVEELVNLVYSKLRESTKYQ